MTLKNRPKEPRIYLDENGVTIKCQDWIQFGDSAEVNGESYLIVDESALRSMVLNGEDVSRVCTSKIDNMRFLFHKKSFNQDISSREVNIPNSTIMSR